MPRKKKRKSDSAVSYVRKTITITKKQDEVIRRNYINLSHWVQDKLGKNCEGIACQGKRKKQR